jgi:hypothetical protein
VVGYGLVCLCVIHKEGVCPSREDINRPMMMILQFVSDFKRTSTSLRFVVVKSSNKDGSNIFGHQTFPCPERHENNRRYILRGLGSKSFD